MFENLKIRNRLGKAFRIIVTTCSIAAVLGVVMLIVTMTLYKNALNNYGFSQGDIGKALVAFTDTRSATRAIVGYDDDSLISQMSDTHDERKATFEQYWEIVDEVTTTSKEQEIYDSIDAKLAYGVISIRKCSFMYFFASSAILPFCQYVLLSARIASQFNM